MKIAIALILTILSAPVAAKDLFVADNQAGGVIVLTDETGTALCKTMPMAYLRGKDSMFIPGCWEARSASILVEWTLDDGSKKYRAYDYNGWRNAQTGEDL